MYSSYFVLDFFVNIVQYSRLYQQGCDEVERKTSYPTAKYTRKSTMYVYYAYTINLMFISTA